MTSISAIRVAGLVHRYGDRVAVNGLTFDVPAGEIFVLLGPNGSGKTTLFRVLSTLIPLQSGEADVCGHSIVQETHAVRGLLGVVFQAASLDRKEGFLQSVLVAPIPRWAMVLGKVIGGAAITMLQGLMFLAVGWALPAVEITGGLAGVFEAIALMALVAVALTALGFSLAWRMDSTQGFHAVMSVFLFPMWLLSGAFFPQGGEGILGWIVAANPLTYGVAGIRRALQTGGEASVAALESLPSRPVCWGVTLLFAAVMLALAWRLAATRSRGDLL